jgi:hypothetical protein
MLQHIRQVTEHANTWDTSGPRGLHNALLEWGHLRGRAAFVPFHEVHWSWYVNLTKDFEESAPAGVPPESTFTFVNNELVDPAACNAGTLAHCHDSFCNATWPTAYVIHHCFGNWRGTYLGNSRR